MASIQEYWEQVAKKAGLADEQIGQVAALLGDEKVSKAFSDNFKMLPDYSRGLDEVRDKARSEGAKSKEDEYKSWYNDTKTKYDQYTSSLATLEQYKKVYGPLEGAKQHRQAVQQGSGFTQEQLDQIIEERLSKDLDERFRQRDQSYIDLLEIRERHMQTFKEPLATKEFESFWREHPELGNMNTAYREFVTPRIEERREAETADKLKAAREEGLRDGLSQQNAPGAHGRKGFSPLFDRQTEIDKMGDLEKEQHSRAAFLEAMQEAGTADNA
jgi:hypothetical protein